MVNGDSGIRCGIGWPHDSPLPPHVEGRGVEEEGGPYFREVSQM